MIKQPTVDEIDEFIGGLTDEVLAECVRTVLPTVPRLDECGQGVFLKLNPRKSPRLKEWVYKAFAPSKPKPNWNVDVAADFEGNELLDSPNT